ncbi:MAG: hypothetical protein HY914_06735 [Desulfomonile tiedjei]|nr:hypothetical protein [Desulfomonile tiedjei]
MKIRTDYVTNSSSTSYIVICDGQFTRAKLSKMMGIPKKSPLSPLVDALYDCIRQTGEPAELAWREDPRYGDSLETFLKGRFSHKVWERAVEAQQEGKRIWVGSLSSEETAVETLFCCDSFEWENDEMYINALNCVW